MTQDEKQYRCELPYCACPKATVNSSMTMHKGLNKPWNRDELLDVVIAPVVQDLNVYSIARDDS